MQNSFTRRHLQLAIRMRIVGYAAYVQLKQEGPTSSLTFALFSLKKLVKYALQALTYTTRFCIVKGHCQGRMKSDFLCINPRLTAIESSGHTLLDLGDNEVEKTCQLSVVTIKAPRRKPGARSQV